MQISKKESEALETLKKNELEIFSTKDFRLLLGLSMTKTYNLLKSLKNKKHIKLIRNGLYCTPGTDEMAIGPRIVYPSYISFLSALNYYGLSDQFPTRITLATTKRKKHKDYMFITIDKNKFFGYTRINNIVIAEKEKALIDALYLPKYAGGMKEIIKCFEGNEIDKKRLYDYAIKMNSKIIVRRLGFIMEHLKIKFNLKLINKIGKGFELLDPSQDKKHNYNKKWLLDVNI